MEPISKNLCMGFLETTEAGAFLQDTTNNMGNLINGQVRRSRDGGAKVVRVGKTVTKCGGKVDGSKLIEKGSHPNIYKLERQKN